MPRRHFLPFCLGLCPSSGLRPSTQRPNQGLSPSAFFKRLTAGRSPASHQRAEPERGAEPHHVAVHYGGAEPRLRSEGGAQP